MPDIVFLHLNAGRLGKDCPVGPAHMTLLDSKQKQTWQLSTCTELHAILCRKPIFGEMAGRLLQSPITAVTLVTPHTQTIMKGSSVLAAN